MKVQFEIFDEDGYNSYRAMLSDLYPNDSPPTIEEYTEIGTGEIIEFIKGRFWSKDMFLIADDKTGKFRKIKVSDCKVLKD